MQRQLGTSPPGRTVGGKKLAGKLKARRAELCGELLLQHGGRRPMPSRLIPTLTCRGLSRAKASGWRRLEQAGALRRRRPRTAQSSGPNGLSRGRPIAVAASDLWVPEHHAHSRTTHTQAYSTSRASRPVRVQRQRRLHSRALRRHTGCEQWAMAAASGASAQPAWNPASTWA